MRPAGPGRHRGGRVGRRERDRDALWQRFVADGVAEGAAPPPEAPQPVVDAAVAFVDAHPSPLALLPVEDLLGQEEQPNLPGTVDRASRTGAAGCRAPVYGTAARGGTRQACRRRSGRTPPDMSGRTRSGTSGQTIPGHGQPHRLRTARDDAAAAPRWVHFRRCAPSSCPICTTGHQPLYASPILTARAGSMHGYDVVDPTRVNPELGGEAGLRRLVSGPARGRPGPDRGHRPEPHGGRRQRQRLVAGRAAHGPASRYARYFDIDWDPADPALHGKVLAPFLGQPYGRGASGRRHQAGCGCGAARPSSAISTTAIRLLPPDHAEIAAAGPAAYDPATEDGRARLHRCWSGSITVWPGGAPRATRSTGAASSTSTASPACALRSRRCSKRPMPRCSALYAEGLIDGVRIDHVDGLTDPPGYCRRLRARLEALTAARPASAWPSDRTSWSKRFWAPTKRCRPTGVSTAPAATTS